MPEDRKALRLSMLNGIPFGRDQRGKPYGFFASDSG